MKRRNGHVVNIQGTLFKGQEVEEKIRKFAEQVEENIRKYRENILQ